METDFPVIEDTRELIPGVRVRSSTEVEVSRVSVVCGCVVVGLGLVVVPAVAKALAGALFCGSAEAETK